MQGHKFGLLGQGISYSRSPELFKKIWGCAAVRFSFELIDITDISAFISEVRHDCQWGGFTVTTPYKVDVLQYIDAGLSPIAEEVGAVNVIRRTTDGRLSGHNSDVLGFIQALHPLITDCTPTRALVLGTGGASRAVQIALRHMNIEYTTVSRSHEHASLTYQDLDSDIIRCHSLIINATPLGSAKHPDVRPPLPYSALTPEHLLFDLTYSPSPTPFLAAGLDHGATARNGFGMLWYQAIEAWRYWNEDDI